MNQDDAKEIFDEKFLDELKTATKAGNIDILDVNSQNKRDGLVDGWSHTTTWIVALEDEPVIYTIAREK